MNEIKQTIAPPRCKNCDSASVYVMKNRTIVCRRCGFREPYNRPSNLFKQIEAREEYDVRVPDMRKQ